MLRLTSVLMTAALLGVACADDAEPPVTSAANGGDGQSGSASSGNAGQGQGGGLPENEGGSANDGGASADAGSRTVVGRVQRANPIISRGATVFASSGQGAAAVDGQYHNGGWFAGSPSEAAPSWVAVKLAAGPTRLLVSWDDGGTYNYQDLPSVTVYGLPGAYHIDVSADSTNGADGTWEQVVSVSANAVRTRAHAFDFDGRSWVKLVITAPPPNANGGNVSIAEIDVHDVSATGAGLPEDSWFFMGDSITAFAYDRALIHQPSFATGINAAVPAFLPAMINGGIGGETSAGALLRLPEVLSLNPDYRFFILGYGTNDASGNQISVAAFKANLQAMIDLLEAAGREPIIPRIPLSEDGNHASIPAYNAAIDELTLENDLVVGADLFAYFSDNDGLFTCPPCGNRMTDNLHPNDTGLAGMNAVWTQAMRALYP